MYTVKSAELARITERNDVRCADVEVQVEGWKDLYLVEFRESRDDDLDMTHIYKCDASREIDWYDNNLHEAFRDVSEELFENEAQEIMWGQREQFKQQVLSFGGLREKLLEQFNMLRKAAPFHREAVEDQTFLQ